MSYLTALFILLGVAIVAIVRIRFTQDGRKLERLKNAENTIDTVQKASDAINRIDDDLAAKLHKRYDP